MKTLSKSEELIQFLGAIFLFSYLYLSWWWFPVLLFLPDISMVGYLVSPAVGAVMYNSVHHKGVGVIVGVIGMLFSSRVLMLVGLVLFAHACMDRMFGYGLKYSDGFKHTSLGNV